MGRIKILYFLVNIFVISMIQIHITVGNFISRTTQSSPVKLCDVMSGKHGQVSNLVSKLMDKAYGEQGGSLWENEMLRHMGGFDDKAATLQIIKGPNACKNEHLEI